MCHYSHFNTEKREMSRVLKAQGLSIRAIAKKLGSSPSSVSREFKRNSYINGGYAAHHADKLYIRRRKRRTNENTNGLLKQFFPKGSSFSQISDDVLRYVVDLINNRPRKRLGFLTHLIIYISIFYL